MLVRHRCSSTWQLVQGPEVLPRALHYSLSLQVNMLDGTSPGAQSSFSLLLTSKINSHSSDMLSAAGWLKKRLSVHNLTIMAPTAS